MLSPRSRGKGSRRPPGRGGGKRKRQPVQWRKRAGHALDDVAQLSGPLEAVQMHGWRGDSATELIYKFDQRMAEAGIRYFADCQGHRHCWTFTVWIPAEVAATVSSIVAQLKRSK